MTKPKIRYRARDEYDGDYDIVTVTDVNGKRLRVPVASMNCVVCDRPMEDDKPGLWQAAEPWVWIKGRKIPLGWPRHEHCDRDRLVAKVVVLTMLAAIQK